MNSLCCRPELLEESEELRLLVEKLQEERLQEEECRLPAAGEAV